MAGFGWKATLNEIKPPLVWKIQGVFFNWPSPENVSRLAPPPKKCLDWPPYIEKVLSMRGEIPNTLTFSIPRGASLGL